MSRTIDVNAAEFAAVRATLKLSQGEYAERLGISRRTVIRGERRGIELPSRYSYSAQANKAEGRDGLRDRWGAALKEAQAVAKGDTFPKILANVSQRLAGEVPREPEGLPLASSRAQLAAERRARTRLALGRRPAPKGKSLTTKKPKKLARRKRR